eukprot:361448-Chlamydomonas_euryale.AAC.7
MDGWVRHLGACVCKCHGQRSCSASHALPPPTCSVPRCNQTESDARFAGSPMTPDSETTAALNLRQAVVAELAKRREYVH